MRLPQHFFRSVRRLSQLSWKFTGASTVRLHVRQPLLVRSEWSDVVTVESPNVGASGGSPVLDNNGVVVVDENVIIGEVKDGASGLVVKIPERCNLVVESDNGKVEVKGKVEGDVNISAGSGDVELDKVRGKDVHVVTNGAVNVGTTIEGEKLVITAQTLVAKRMMGDVVTLSSRGGAEVGALYAQKFHLVDRSDVGVKLGAVHGQGMIESASLRIESIDGAVSATCEGEIDVGFDTIPHGQCGLVSTKGDVCISLPAPQEHDTSFTEIVADAKTVSACETEFEIVDTGAGNDTTGKRSVKLVSSTTTAPGTKPLGVAGVGKININQASKETFLRSSKAAPRILASALLGSVTLKHVSWVDRIKNKFK